MGNFYYQVIDVADNNPYVTTFVLGIPREGIVEE